MRRKAIAAAVATTVYFAVAYYFKVSFVPDVPRRDDVAIIHSVMTTAIPGTFFAYMWLPDHVTSVFIYENGIPLGPANAVYDDPNGTTFRDGKRWKYIEFNTKGGHARRWLVFTPSSSKS
jgi:hypothetical protein